MLMITFASNSAKLREENQKTLRDMSRLSEVQTTEIQETAAVNATYSEQAIRDEIERTNEAARNRVPLSPTGPIPTVQGQSRGGLIRYFDRGGFAPRGTDTVPAMLSPGEFVINARSARKFYSELVAINAGVRPVYRAAVSCHQCW
jgi:hypothetical protein